MSGDENLDDEKRESWEGSSTDDSEPQTTSTPPPADLKDDVPEHLRAAIGEAEALKDDGNRCFCDGKLDDAATKYSAALELLAALTVEQGRTCRSLSRLQLLIIANQAQVQLKQKKYDDVKRTVRRATLVATTMFSDVEPHEIPPQMARLLFAKLPYRLAQAHFGCKEYRDSLNAVQAVFDAGFENDEIVMFRHDVEDAIASANAP